MNCSEANKIPVTHVLAHHYQCFGETKDNNVWYSSPFSKDKTPSFRVRRDRNDWIDFSTGKKGTVIDLVCELSRVSIAGALLILSGIKTANTDLSFFEKQELTERETQFKINHVQPLQNAALIQYLQGRKIPYQIASQVPQLKEAYYTANNKRFFALAFENDLGGFELRSKYFKGSTSPKTITTIEGPGTGLNLFEGFMDFLSALTFFPKHSHNTTIVLNSLVNLDKVDLIRYNKINLFLDTDAQGIKAATEIMKQHTGAVNRSQQFYNQYKDFNEYLLTI